MWRVHQLVSLVQDVPVVHVCLVVPASEVRTMHSKQPCHWNVSRIPREETLWWKHYGEALLPQLTSSGGLMGGPPKVCDFTSAVLNWRAPQDACCFRPSILALNSMHTHMHYIGCGTTPSSLFLSSLLSGMSCCMCACLCVCVCVCVCESVYLSGVCKIVANTMCCMY